MTAQAASAEPARVFFDWNKSEISRDGEQALASVVAGFAASPGTIMVSGYSDRSGPAAANRAASLRRAMIVADYLVQRGIPKSRMRIVGHGEGHALVPTEDGVREVQNRRVDVRLSR
jgi:OOP family OmpA-OmpF porin